jgi:serine protease Do
MKTLIQAFAFLTGIFFFCGSSLHAASPQTVSEGKALSDNFASVAEKVKPCVVSVSTTSQVMLIKPSDFFFGRRHGSGTPETREVPHGMGSGILIEGGYVLTNNHVIEDAITIYVKLGDGRQVKAKVVGADPDTDVAVVKISGIDKLPAAELGNSDNVRVGDWVMAIGNPFGFDQTVTAGIISAKGRSNVNVSEFSDFIQTDAAINPGNSGGALVDLDGKVIGINSAIFSQTGGYEGIGFAIPINMAKNVMESLIKSGKVARGYLGAQIQNVTPQLAEMLKLNQMSGVVVAHVEPDSPAAKAGIQPNDIITRFNGVEITSDRNLVSLIRTTPVGQTAELKLIRDGQEKNVKVTIAAATPTIAAAETLGIEVSDIEGAYAQHYGYENGTPGVIITRVAPNSKADSVGLEPGDLILSINKQAVKNLKSYNDLMTKLMGSEKLLLQIVRGRQHNYVVVPLK